MKHRGGICSIIQVFVALEALTNVCARTCPMVFDEGQEIICVKPTNTNISYYKHRYQVVTLNCLPLNFERDRFKNIDCTAEDLKILNTNMDYKKTLSIGPENPHSTLRRNFLGYFKNVENITLDGANIAIIESGAFDDTGKVTHLNLRNNRIETLPPYIFYNIRHLEHLDLGANLITKLPVELFTNLFYLERLSLNNNRLESLGNSIFFNLRRLEFLNLRHNKLRRIESNTFAQNTQLSTLWISYNEITYLSANAFRINNKLSILEMSHNRLKEISSGAFVNLKSLGRLVLSWNEITEIEGEAFPENNKLDWLDLSGNQLSKIRRSDFSRLMPLKEGWGCSIFNELGKKGEFWSCRKTLLTINLSYNKLVDLSKVFLYTGIQKLILSGNENIFLRNETFAGMTNLVTLVMEACNLASLPEGLFRYTPNLENLSLKNNSICEIDLTGHPFSNFRNLDLSYNKIEMLDVSNLTKLSDLDISHNSIVKLEGGDHLAFLDRFDASYNFLMNFTLLAPTLIVLNVSHNHISSLSNLKISDTLLKLDVSYNNLSVINTEQWKKILCVKKFDARGNYIQELIMPEPLACGVKNMNYWGEKEIHLENNNIKLINLPKITERRFPSETGNHPYNDVTLNIYLSENPMLCGCSAYNLYKYLKEFDIAQHYIQIRDELTCHYPSRLEGKFLKALEPTEFLCDYNDYCVNTSLCALPYDCKSRCNCYLRPYDDVRIVDCINKDYDDLPFDVPQNTELLYMDHNRLKSLAGLKRLVWQNLKDIHVEYNEVESEDITIPDNATMLSLKGNKLRTFPASIQSHADGKSDFKVTLSENLWPCECSVLPLKTFLLEHSSKVIDIDNVTCSFPNGSVLVLKLASDLNLCPHSYNNIPMYVSIAVAVVGLIIGLCSVLYSYYKIYVLVFLYTRCNWCYRLLCCDRRIKETKIFDGFISYSSQDTEMVLEILHQLEERPPNYQFCVHERNWMPGSLIINNILYSVRNSRKTLVVLSAAFLRSDWFELEFDAAFHQSVQDRRERMIIIVKGELPPHSELPEAVRYVLSTRTYLRWGDPWFFDKLRYAMNEELPFMRRQMHEGSNDSKCIPCLSSSGNDGQEVIELRG